MTRSDVPRLLVVQHEPDTGLGAWGPVLAGAGLELVVSHPYAGDDLPPAATYDGVLVLGGAMGPADDEACPWLPATRALLAESVDAGVPVFGICLGAELLALACGGAVRHGTVGPELGVLGIEMLPASADDPVLSALPARPRVLQWHWEEISSLPPGAVWLASSGAYAHQAFRLGTSAWGVQGHPEEVTAGIARAWAREDAPLLVAAGRAPDDLVDEVAAAESETGEVWGAVASAFAAVVVRAAAGAGRAGR